MNMKKFWLIMLVISTILLAGCQVEDTTQPVDAGDGKTTQTDDVQVDEGSQSDDAGSETTAEFSFGELGQMNTLALGTLLLEGGDEAVTPDQAVGLTPLWQVVQSGNLRSQSETDAVLNQIEGKITDSQLSAIEEMVLTQADMTAWIEEQGVDISVTNPGGLKGDMSDEERAEMREQLQNLTEEEREERMAELGIQAPGGTGDRPGAAGGTRGGNTLLNSLVDLLSERAAE